MLVDALHVVVVDVVLRVQQLEHALHQTDPEIIDHFFQVHVSPSVIEFQFRKQSLENVGVLRVQIAVSTNKHLVQRALGFLQELQEEIYPEKNVAKKLRLVMSEYRRIHLTSNLNNLRKKDTKFDMNVFKLFVQLL